MGEVIIDVREPNEYAGKHAKNSINIPLSNFTSRAPEILQRFPECKIIFMCHSGVRASQALAHANKTGSHKQQNYSVYSGGIIQWIASGHPIESK